MLKQPRPVRSGFTLIELLVVIAIIAVLASILFPVFAQAREKARQTSCTSNARQVALAFSMYQQDYDGRFPQLYYVGGGTKTVPDNFGLNRWPWLVQPYVKSFDLFICPSDMKSPSSRDKKDPLFGYNFGLFPSWGYNARYLSPSKDMLIPDYADYDPIGESQVTSPAETVMLVESTWYSTPQHGLPPDKPEIGYYRVYPPSQWAGAPPLDGLSYGHVWFRHFNSVATTAFADGHVRGMNPGALNKEDLWKATK